MSLFYLEQFFYPHLFAYMIQLYSPYSSHKNGYSVIDYVAFIFCYDLLSRSELCLETAI